MVKEKKLNPAQQAKLDEQLRKEYEKENQRILQQQQKRDENSIRMAVLKDTYKRIEMMNKKIAKIFAQNDKELNWQRYSACEIGPSPKNPAQLRNFLYKWQLNTKDQLQKCSDWMLKIDERSLLDQNLARVDLSEKYLRSCQSALAPPYFTNIQEALIILEEVDDVVENPNAYKIGNELLEEIRKTEQIQILKAREEYQLFFWIYLDQLSHTITGNIDRETQCLNPKDSIFMATSPSVSIGIFTHKDIPLPDFTLEPDKLRISLDSTKVILECPHSMSFDGFVMRVLWFNFDHYSDLAPSHGILFEDDQYLKQTLLQSCRIEWEIRESLELNELNRMKTERDEYEAYIIHIDNFKSKGKPHKIQMKEPPKVSERTVIDMSEEIRRLNENEHNARMEKLNPNTGLHLSPFELNQRQFKIIGGTFAIHYLKRPAQSKKFINHMFQKTYTLPNVMIYESYIKPYSQKNNQKDQEEVQFNELLEITIDLPPNACWWEHPKVVRWQKWEESDEFLSLRTELQNYNIHFDEIQLAKSMLLFNRIIKRQQKDGVIEDFDLVEQRSDDISLYYVMTKYIVPKLSLTYRFECEMHEEEEKLARELKRREHLRREQEEDLRLHTEEEERILKEREKEEELKLLRAQNSDEDSDEKDQEPEELSIKSPSPSELTAKIVQNIVPGVMKRIVQGTPAQELFPSGGEGPTPNIVSHDNKPSINSNLLSQLIQSIDAYNQSELPIFNETGDEISSSDENEDKLRKNIKKQKGKKNCGNDDTPEVFSNTKDNRLYLVPHHKGKWTEDGIYVQNFDQNARKIRFKAAQIGIFGFAQNQYVNFPFQHWECKPNTEELQMSVKFSIVGTHITLEIVIVPGGFQLTTIRPRPKVCPVKAPETTMTLKSLINFLKKSNMNIFPSIDAIWYMREERGFKSVSYKHEPMANHIYQAMAYFCQTHQFKLSQWNRLCGRCEAILLSRQIIEGRSPEEFAELKITPYDAYFVQTSERCTPIEVVELEYNFDPPEPEFSCDMFELLTGQSIDKSKKKQISTNDELKFNLVEFLNAVQPLSYS